MSGVPREAEPDFLPEGDEGASPAGRSDLVSPDGNAPLSATLLNGVRPEPNPISGVSCGGEPRGRGQLLASTQGDLVSVRPSPEIPPSAFNFYDSFHHSKTMREQDPLGHYGRFEEEMKMALTTEEAMLEGLRREKMLAMGQWRLQDYFEALVQAQGGELLPRRIAAAVAATESSALLLNHPFLYVYSYRGVPLYRLLRTIELAVGNEVESQHFQRGEGKTLLVGSGNTLPEVFATQVLPPEPEEVIAAFHNQYKFLDLVSAEVLGEQAGENLLHSQAMRIRDSETVALEPDEVTRRDFETLKASFVLPPGLVRLHPDTLGEAMQKGFAWDQEDEARVFNTIGFVRADPGLFPADPREILYPLLHDHLAERGTFLLTVGTGNNNQEEQDRFALLQKLERALRKLSFMSVSSFSGKFSSESDKVYYGAYSGMGNTGCFVAQRRPQRSSRRTFPVTRPSSPSSC